jgi:hypothetical protein
MATEQQFSDNLLRAVVAQLHFLNGITAAREMFGKSYFSLGPAERVAVDQTVLAHIGANYHSLTPEALAAQKPQQPVGFGIQSQDVKT